MAQAPVMPLWTDALIGDTTHLSTREFGAYLLLLIATWRNNGQPFADDDKILARICRMPTYEWKSQIRKRLVPFFNLNDGSWRQKRLEKEWAYCSARGRTSRRNGAMGGRPSAPKPLEPNEPENPAGSSQVNLDGTQKEPALTLNLEEGSVSPGGDTASRPPPKLDRVKEIFDRGVVILGGDTLNHRKLIGQMRKRWGDVAVLAAVVECEATMPSDPASYFIACCERRKSNGTAADGLNILADWARSEDEPESFCGYHQTAS